MHKLALIGVAGWFSLATPALAQTTAGVFGPNISEGDRSAQFRIAMSPGENGDIDRWEARIHYQYALQDDLRARLVLQGSNLEAGDFESNFLQAELQWQFKKSDPQSIWASALRLDARIVEEDDGPHRLGLNWTNQWNPNGRWQINNVLLTALEVGPDARDGVILEMRNGVKYRLDSGLKIGVESFSALGRSDNLGGFNSQNHRLGPVVTGKLTDETSFLAGALFGVSDPARDTDFRIWLTRRF